MNIRSKWACVFSIRELIDGGWAYLWTLTTADAVDLPELSRRWRKLIWNGFTPCVRVFEKHPQGHGYHVHFVTADRIDVNALRVKTDAAGFGRIHAKRVPGRAAEYIAKYLTKQRATAPGIRMWACVGFVGSKTKDIVIHDPRWEDLKLVMNKYPAPAGYNFYARRELAVKRLRSLEHEAWHDDKPGFVPTFPALYRRWKDNPMTSIGKPSHWWHLAASQSIGAAAAWWESLRPSASQSDTAHSGVDRQIPLPSIA